MDKTLIYNSRNNEIIKDEIIGEILLHINPQTSVPAVANISDLNKITIGLFLKKAQQNETTVFNGGLGDLLEHMYAGTSMLEVVKTKLSDGYNFLLNFEETPFVVSGQDEFRISINAGLPSEAFTSAVTAGTTMNLYTNPTTKGNSYGVVPLFRTYPVGNNEDSFSKSLGNSVSKIVIVNHPTDNYDTTTNAIPDTIQLSASGSFTENITGKELQARNQKLTAYNPSTPVKNLIHYAGTPLNSVQYNVKFDDQCTKDHKVLTTQLVSL